jgi:hypothetical protein
MRKWKFHQRGAKSGRQIVVSGGRQPRQFEWCSGHLDFDKGYLLQSGPDDRFRVIDHPRKALTSVFAA